MSSIFGDIPIVGDILGGGKKSSGLAGGVMNMTGIPQMLMSGVLIFVGIEVLFKIIDKI